MNNIEIFAFIVLIFIVMKILTILISPKSWFRLADKLWKHPKIVMIISLILAIIVFNSLIKEITIIQMFAVLLLVALLSAISLAVYSKEFIALGHNILKDRKFMKKGWLSILIWVILVIWGLIELFA